jgi:hypothetical protein
MGLPPPEGSKKDVFKLRSVNNIVIAPANTGKLVTNKTAVIITAQMNRGSVSRVNFLEARAQKIVHKKLIAPKIELAPAICSEKIAISTPTPEWN